MNGRLGYCLSSVLLIIPLLGFSNGLLKMPTMPTMQSIQGAFMFSNAAQHRIYIRIGVNPGALAKHQTSSRDIMQKITVVACTHGTCEFAKPLYGLGFYSVDFPVTKKWSEPADVLVVACSHLGCVKKTLSVRYVSDLKMDNVSHEKE